MVWLTRPLASGPVAVFIALDISHGALASRAHLIARALISVLVDMATEVVVSLKVAHNCWFLLTGPVDLYNKMVLNRRR